MRSKLLTLSASIAVLVVSSLALADSAPTLSYQGRLLQNDGTPENGVITLKFSIYDAATAGTLLWTESQDVTASNGYYSALLGAATLFDESVFAVSGRFLELQVGSSDPLSPRQPITTVPYAMTCNRAAVASAVPVDSLWPEHSVRLGLITDVARGRPVSISAGTIYDFGPTGDFPTSGYWKTNTFPSSMTVDLGGDYQNITRVSFESFGRGDARFIPAYTGTAAYVLEYRASASDPNTGWTKIPTVSPYSGDEFVHLTNSITARYLRLTVTAPSIAGNPVQVGTFKVLSHLYGDSTAIDARRLYLPDPANPGQRQPFCFFAASCPAGTDKGEAGFILNLTTGTSCPYRLGGQHNSTWYWCHPRLCCN